LLSVLFKNLEKWLKEAKEFKEKGDMLQSCEKLYSVVESIIKVLAEKENVEAYKEAISAGGWNTYLLGKASAELKEIYSQKFGEDFGNFVSFPSE
jgi:Archaeal PaREP1/PaREP8 family.